MKKIFVLLLTLTSLTAFSQRDSFVPHSYNLYANTIVSTSYTNPLLGLTGEFFVPIDKSITNVVIRPGIWINPLTNENFWVIQAGVNVDISKKLSLGGYFMNKHSFLPRPYYPKQEDAKNEGYNSPFSLFAIITPFKDSKISMKAEYMWFWRYNVRKDGENKLYKSDCMITISYRLFNYEAKK